MDVNGECCQKNFLNGVHVTIILAREKGYDAGKKISGIKRHIAVDTQGLGYSGDSFANGVEKLLHCRVEVAKRSELHTFKVIPKRWVVERSFAWLEKCRRLWKNCERKLNTSLHMVIIAFVVLLVKKL